MNTTGSGSEGARLLFIGDKEGRLLRSCICAIRTSSQAMTKDRSKKDSGSDTFGPSSSRVDRIATLAHITQAALSLCVVSQNSHRLARMSCFTHCLIHIFLLHSVLRPLPLCFSRRTGQTPAPRQPNSCLSVLLNSLRSKGDRDAVANRSLAAFAGHPNVIIQGDPEHAPMAVIDDACATLTSATPRTSRVNSERLKWSSRESSTVRRRGGSKYASSFAGKEQCCNGQ